MFKRILTGCFALALSVTALATSALAYVDSIDANKYGTNYSKSGYGNENYFYISGTANQTMTSISNTTGKYNRYLCTYVARKSMTTGSVIASDSDDVTTTNAGVMSSISRPSRTDSSVYYYHNAEIKNEQMSFTIDSVKWAVSQIPNWQRYLIITLSQPAYLIVSGREIISLLRQ